MHRCGSGFLLTVAIIFRPRPHGLPGQEQRQLRQRRRAERYAEPLRQSLDRRRLARRSLPPPPGMPPASQSSAQHSITSSPAETPDAPAPLSIASNGNACAGTWDPSVSICSPGTAGIAIVTAVVEGVSSPPTTVYVHQHIDSIQVMPVQQTQPPQNRLLFPGTDLAVSAASPTATMWTSPTPSARSAGRSPIPEC